MRKPDSIITSEAAAHKHNKGDRSMRAMMKDLDIPADVRPEEIGHITYKDLVDLSAPQHFDIANVSRLLYREALERGGGEAAMELATLAPPFEYTMFHYPMWHTETLRGGGVIHTEATTVEAFGIDLKHLPEDRDGLPVVSWGFEEDARWWMQMDLSVTDEPQLAGVEFQVDETGQVLPHTVEHFYNRIFMAICETAGIPQDAWHKTINSMIYPTLFSISLLNCKNVDVAERKVSRQLKRKHKRKNLPEPIQYKTLVLAPFMAQAQTSAEGGQGGVAKAFHMCRGSFATYTKDKPAFGQPWGAGTFWRPGSAKGSMAAGQVQKDYKVETDGRE